MNEPAPTLVTSHVQSSAGPMPEPSATVAPVESCTVTVQPTAPDSRAVKRTSPPGEPFTAGA